MKIKKVSVGVKKFPRWLLQADCANSHQSTERNTKIFHVMETKLLLSLEEYLKHALGAQTNIFKAQGATYACNSPYWKSSSLLLCQECIVSLVNPKVIRNKRNTFGGKSYARHH